MSKQLTGISIDIIHFTLFINKLLIIRKVNNFLFMNLQFMVENVLILCV